MKFKNCLKCGKKVSKNCHTGYCNKCRDRSGEKNPFFGKKQDREMIERTKLKLSAISKKKWEDKEYRDKVIKGTSKPRREGFKEEQSQRVKEWYKNNPNQRSIRSDKMRKSWADGRIEPNDNSMNESGLEREFREELKKRLPDKNVRKSTIRIGKRWFYPDVRIGKYFLIEFYGNYWHANPKMFKPDDIVHHGLTAKQIWEFDKERIDSLVVSGGFDVFIVWQDEWKTRKEDIIDNIKSNL